MIEMVHAGLVVRIRPYPFAVNIGIVGGQLVANYQIVVTTAIQVIGVLATNEQVATCVSIKAIATAEPIENVISAVIVTMPLVSRRVLAAGFGASPNLTQVLGNNSILLYDFDDGNWNPAR